METKYKINSKFEATIFDRTNKSSKVTNEEYFQLFRSLRGRLSLNHGVDFYDKLFKAIDEYKMIEVNFDIHDLIGVLDSQITKNKMLNDTYIELKDDVSIDDVINSPLNKFLINDYQDSLIPNEELLNVKELFTEENTENHSRLKSIFRESDSAYYYNNDKQIVFTDNNNIPVIMEFKDFSEEEIIKELVYANYIEFSDILNSEYFDDKFQVAKIKNNDLEEELEKEFNEYRFDFNINKFEENLSNELMLINSNINEENIELTEILKPEYRSQYNYLKEITADKDNINGQIFLYFNNLMNNNYNDVEDILEELNLTENELSKHIKDMNRHIDNLIDYEKGDEVIGIYTTPLFIYDMLENYEKGNLIELYQDNINRYYDKEQAEELYGFEFNKYFDKNFIKEEYKINDKSFISSNENTTNYKLVNKEYIGIGEYTKQTFGNRKESQNDYKLDVLLDKFNKGNINYDEHEVLTDDKTLDDILDKYGQYIFDDETYNLVSGISETTDEIIVKRSEENAFNWDIKSFNKKAGYLVELENTETLDKETQLHDKLIYQGFSEKEELGKWELIILNENNIVEYLTDVNEVIDPNKLEYDKTDIHIEEAQSDGRITFDISSGSNLEFQDYLLRNINDVPYEKIVIDDYSEYIEMLTNAVVLDEALDTEKLIKEFSNADPKIFNEIIYQTLTDENFKNKFERYEIIDDYNNKIEEKIEKPLKKVSENISKQNIVSMLRDKPLDYQEESEQLLTKFSERIEQEHFENKRENLEDYFNHLTIDKSNDVLEMLDKISKGEMFDELEEHNLQKLTKFSSDEKIVFKGIIDELEIDNKLDLIIGRAVDTLSENELNNLKDLDLGIEIKEKIETKEEEYNKMKKKPLKLIIEEEIQMD